MKRNNIIYIILFTILSEYAVVTQAKDFWNINKDGSISWQVVPKETHFDHIEMSGKRISSVLRYGIDLNGAFKINKSLVFPLLRTIPNNTHASLTRRFNINALDFVSINRNSINQEQVKSITLKGIMTVCSQAFAGNAKVEINRTLFPSNENPAFIEIVEIKNLGERSIDIEISKLNSELITDKKTGIYGSYKIETKITNDGYYNLRKGETVHFGLITTGRKIEDNIENITYQEELYKRISFINEITDNLVLTTPNNTINTMFAFSKIRACESIYQTKGGPMHSPGGESYYAAIWANDQAEYINPYFPFVGYDYGNMSALNTYLHFARFINNDWKPIPSSIIAEGDDIWNGAGDRGDAAMIAYGASRYALMRSDKKEAELLLPLIEWCLEYCHKKLNKSGVVSSDCDELELRFPAGKANLCTSCLYYDALISATYLNKSLKINHSKSIKYQKQAEELRKNIDQYFGSKVEGFDTYRYYEGNDVLRSWICIPLTVGITERAKETAKALFSDNLWTENGLLTQAGSNTFWDRTTLYALRGIYSIGMADKATEYLYNYSNQRLLGEHVPYAIEAWPEGNQRHLSAESALYGRIITEGLFGIRPIGFNKIKITPNLPKDWNNISLKNIGTSTKFDIEITRIKNNKLNVVISKKGTKFMEQTIKSGSSVVCDLH